LSRKGAKGQRKAQRETPKKNLICPLRLYLCAFAGKTFSRKQEHTDLLHREIGDFDPQPVKEGK
jgi:hypothetical protein